MFSKPATMFEISFFRLKALSDRFHLIEFIRFALSLFDHSSFCLVTEERRKCSKKCMLSLFRVKAALNSPASFGCMFRKYVHRYVNENTNENI